MKITKILIIVAIFAGGIYLLSVKSQNNKPSLTVLADTVVRKCKNSEIKSVCYETEIPKLMNIISMEDSFNVASIVQSKVSDFPYCHVLGHKLSSMETKKDPSKWKDVLERCPTGLCSNGCVHGAFQEGFRGDVLTGVSFDQAKAEFKTLCDSGQSFSATGLQQGSCFHALGHLLMYITDANINKSVTTCDEIGKKQDGRDFSRLCYAGAFMQIFQPLDADDRSLTRNYSVNRGNAWDFCKKFPTEKRNICWQETWPLFLVEMSTPDGLLGYCSKLDQNGKSECIKNAFYLMPIQFRFNYTNINKYCSGFQSPYQNLCYAMTASRIMEIDQGNGQKTIDYCQTLPGDNRSACLDKITSDASFDIDPKSPAYKDFCSKLPDPWKNKCLSK